MFDKLKQQPLLWLALAVAAGLVVAHVANRVIDLTYEDALGSDPTSAAAWLCAITLVAGAVYMAPCLYRSYRRKFPANLDWSKLSPAAFRKRVIISAVSVVLLAIFAVACAVWPPMIGIAMAVGLFVLMCRLLVKVYRWRKNEKWRMNPINSPQFVSANPRTAAWASNPDNAAVAGVDEIYRLAKIEHNAAAMRAAEQASPYRHIREVFHRRENEKRRTNSTQENTLSPTARLVLEFRKADAEAALGGQEVYSEPEPGTEARYWQDVHDAIHMMGDKGTLTIYSQLNTDFLKASMEICETGFAYAVPEKTIAGAIADAAVKYQSNPNSGIRYLEQASNIAFLVYGRT